MRYRDSIFADLLKPISRRRFEAMVAAHNGDAYDKVFDSWDHLLALIFAQLGAASSLRGLERSWNANAHHHYHLGSGPIARSTLADANHRRPPAVFAETFAMLSGLADRQLRREGAGIIRILDATPIPLGKLHGWARWNGRTHGLKMHTVFDPTAGHPRRIVITPSTVNDVVIGRGEPLEAGATYVFDKAYCDYRWWGRIHEAEAVFITRLKKNAKFEALSERPLEEPLSGDGFTVLADREVRIGQGNTQLTCRLRCVAIRRNNGDLMDIVTNDLHRSAVEIAALYKTRWTIELLFRWLKQHLKLSRFLGRSENAIRLQACPREGGDTGGDDRLSAPAPRRQSQPMRFAGPAFCRTRRPMPVHPLAHRPHRQAARGQSKPAKTQNRPRTDGVRLWVVPRTALRFRGDFDCAGGYSPVSCSRVGGAPVRNSQ